MDSEGHPQLGRLRGELSTDDEAMLKCYREQAKPMLELEGTEPHGVIREADASAIAALCTEPEYAIAVLVAALDVHRPWATYALAKELLRRELPFSAADASLLISLSEVFWAHHPECAVAGCGGDRGDRSSRSRGGRRFGARTPSTGRGA